MLAENLVFDFEILRKQKDLDFEILRKQKDLELEQLRDQLKNNASMLNRATYEVKKAELKSYDTVNRMLNKGIPLEDIAEFTDLTIEQIVEISKLY